jgi:hypothetical protein
MREWASGVKSSGELTVFSEATGIWVNIIPSAIDSFNKLSKRHGFGVKLKPHKDKATANCVVISTDGTASHDFGGGSVATPKFKGTASHGQTSHAADNTGVIACVVFLPDGPSFQAGVIKGQMTYQAASKDQLRVIAVHEFIHACGLDLKADHDPKEGLFVASLDPKGTKFVEVWTNNPGMPPMRVSPGTISKVKSLW